MPSAKRTSEADKQDRGAKHDLALRITLVRPPAGVGFGVQRGAGAAGEVVSAAPATGEDLSFDFVVRVKDGADADGAARLGGPFVQGPPGGRFVYVCAGTLAGQAGSCWSRRAKVPLGGITPGLVREATGKPGARLEARVPGTAGDGGPVCASVKLVGGGWRVVGETKPGE